MPKQDGSGPPSRQAGWLPQQIDPSEIENISLRKGLELWNRKRADRRMPARAEITPRDMAEFLRNVVLVRVLDGGKEFEFRIVGDAIVVVQGAAFQGMNTKEIDQQVPGYGSALREVYKRLCARGEPQAFRGPAQNGPSGKPFFHESLLLPLGADGETADHILVIGIYSFGPGGKPV